MNERSKKSYRRDLILVGVLLLAAVLLFCLTRGSQKQVSGAQAVVTVDGTEIGRYPLSEEGHFALNGGSNLLVIENGQAWVSEADCPDKVCMGMGRISRNGEFIACLPNRLIIVIEGGESSGVDART